MPAGTNMPATLQQRGRGSTRCRQRRAAAGGEGPSSARTASADAWSANYVEGLLAACEGASNAIAPVAAATSCSRDAQCAPFTPQQPICGAARDGRPSTLRFASEAPLLMRRRGGRRGAGSLVCWGPSQSFLQGYASILCCGIARHSLARARGARAPARGAGATGRAPTKGGGGHAELGKGCHSRHAHRQTSEASYRMFRTTGQSRLSKQHNKHVLQWGTCRHRRAAVAAKALRAGRCGFVSLTNPHIHVSHTHR